MAVCDERFAFIERGQSMTRRQVARMLLRLAPHPPGVLLVAPSLRVVAVPASRRFGPKPGRQTVRRAELFPLSHILMGNHELYSSTEHERVPLLCCFADSHHRKLHVCLTVWRSTYIGRRSKLKLTICPMPPPLLLPSRR